LPCAPKSNPRSQASCPTSNPIHRLQRVCGFDSNYSLPATHYPLLPVPMHDLRYAFRQLLKSPGFTIVAALTLAIGIGANTAIFSTLDAALFRPLPYPHPEQLVQVFEKRSDGGTNSVSGGAFKDWSDHNAAFDSLTLVGEVRSNLRSESSPVRLDGIEVSHDFFRVLGIQPLLGRNFFPSDDQSGGDNNVIILTEELWRSRFGANPDIIGTPLILDDVPRTVIGVAPAGAWFFRDAQFFVPAVLAPNTDRSIRAGHWANVYGRLKSGMTVEQGGQDLRGVKQRLQDQYPVWKKDWSVTVESLPKKLTEETRPALLVLLAAVVLVLVIACANVANLLLARASDRGQEIALRAALGASSARLVRQMLTESLLLAALGGGLGILLSFWGIDVLRQLTADFLPPSMTPQIDGHVLAFSVGLTALTGVLFGLLPAWHFRRPDLNHALKNGGRGATAGGRQRTQSALVVAEVALTVVLLAGAGLLFRSLVKTATVDLGFEPQRVLAFDLSLPATTYKTAEERLAFTRSALERIRALPSVEAAGTGLAVPFAGGGYGEYIGRPNQPDNLTLGRIDFISEGYLEALGTRLLSGRRLEAADNRIGGPRVAVVNQTTIQTFFKTDNPIGEAVTFNGQVWKIVGVIADIPDRKLDGAARPRVYCPYAFRTNDYSVVVRTSLTPMTLVSDIRTALQQLDPGLPIANPRALDQAMAESMTERRLILGLIGAFALTALLLACIGLYGVMAYSVVLRRRELCIRLALGAAPKVVRTLVLRDGLRLALLGLAVGLVGAYAGARLISAMLFGVSAHDPAVLGSVAVILALVAVIACWIPALTASRSDPMDALRAE
jgi:predicted permease